MKARGNRREYATGFSLVELMLVLAIILILTVLAIPEFLKVQQKAYEANAVSFLRTLQSRQESYRLANGFYADNFDDLELYVAAVPEQRIPIAPEGLPLAMLTGPVMPYFPASESVQQAPPQAPPGQQAQFGGVDEKKKKKKQGDRFIPPTPAGGGGSGPAGKPSGRGSDLGGLGPRGSGGSSSSVGSGIGTSSGGGGSGAPSGSRPGAQGGGSGSGGLGSSSESTALKRSFMLKHNYAFTLRRPTPSSWWCAVEPIRERGVSRFFFVDQDGTVRSELGRPATRNSPPM